ncbi:MAG: non-heme iron oxygenase ferredoxin subunit [Chloroflexi bacterium]|nr:non-heme iron oxygenase ferredoxin subunit [Chloroflexota bacterium]MCH8351978.1 non-heme iron oxygenase ferredoxin subunit [Chloroflexota bacterium]MCI0781046.1 non-heme iron oxygenase ferredoxin subunit [Chloroflexota bacterium]MCI0785386.1 non-heme iron oxygenase ferredoxin subunit [Chloroflexota bacterium]MCI0794783.1 non-heme iron oxygenase ferredoxin subunit [Chloroflexota bacterium]
MAESGFVKVAEVGEISPGDMKVVEVGEDQILLVNVEGNIHACDDICSHAYASLSEGDLNGDEIECPLHGSAFNIITGEALTPPAEDSIRVFEVRIEGQDVLVGPAKG